MLTGKKGASFGTIVAVFGSILIAVGVAWLIAQNWHQLPSAVKIVILLVVTSAAYTSGTIFRVKGHQGTGKSLLILGALLYTLSIFLIAQIFSTSTSFQGTAWLLLLAWIGVIAAAYLFDSSASLVIALFEFIIWLVIQFIAFMEAKDDMISPGILAFYFLTAGILLYGLSLFHRSKGYKFARVYQWWTAFYFLLFTYILTFQTLLPLMWPKEAASASNSLVFLLFFGIAASASILIGLVKAVSNKSVQNKEIFAFIAVVVLLGVIIGLTSFVSEDNGDMLSWFLGGRGEVSTALWAMWIFVNITFILAILGIIFYGTWQKLPKIINLGVIFFGLDVITRYVGFIMDLWGYTSLSVIFITGGIVLLAGGYFIEKWRRNLITKTEPAKKTK